MGRLSVWPAVFGLAVAMIVVTLARPVENSLAYASSGLVLIALLGWVLEARAVAGPPPPEELEHEAEEEPPPGPSYWPVVLALGVVGIAVGLIEGWEYGALLVAVPLAVASGAAWGAAARREMAELTPSAEALALGPPLVTAEGRVLMPVAPRVLAAQAAAGAAIAIEVGETRQVSRRSLLRVTFWTGLLAGIGAFTAGMVDMLYPRGITGFGGVVSAGTVDQFPPGSKKELSEGKLWLVHLTEEQAKRSDAASGKAGFMALWWKCPHLGCTVPWRETFVFNDRPGWFRCPCHGSTYDDAGVRVFGPAPRSLDHFELTIDPNSKRISVNTGKVTKGTPDNARFAVKG